MMNHRPSGITKPFPCRINAYLAFHVGHEHRKTGQVCAGTAGVCVIGGQETTVLRGPESHHGTLGIAPE